MNIRQHLRSAMLVSLCSVAVSGCSQWQSPFSVNANSINEPNYEQPVDAGSVALFTERPSQSVQLLSIVTGDSCQKRMDQPKASTEQARLALQRDAARFKADAVIQSQCYALPKAATSTCYTQVSCFGKAVKFTR